MPKRAIFDCIAMCSFFIGIGFAVGGGGWTWGCEDNVKSYESA